MNLQHTESIAAISIAKLGYYIDWVISHPFFSILIGPVAAAFFGTWGAQKLAERLAKRKELILQINGINLAIAYTISIIDTISILKKQIVLPAFSEYQQNALNRNKLIAVETSSIPPKASNIILKMQNFPSTWAPIEHLKETFSTFNANSDSIALLVKLTQSISALENMIKERNKFISEYRDRVTRQDQEPVYFGERNSKDQIDQRYKNYMQNIMTDTDDCLGYCTILYETLNELGHKISVNRNKNMPSIYKAEFICKELIPDLKKYRLPNRSQSN